MLRGNCLSGPGGYWERKGEEKQRSRNVSKFELQWDWFHTVLFSPQKAICLNWKIQVKLLWTLKVSGSLHNDQAMVSHWLLVETSVSTFLCHWALISPINFLGWGHPYLYFLHHVCDIFDPLFQCFQLMQFSLLCFCFSVQVQRTFCAAEAPITTREWDDNCLYKENIGSFPSSWNILSAPLRTHDSSVKKSCWVWPDKAKEIWLSKSEVRKSSLAYGFMTLTNSFSTKAEATQFCIFLLRRLKIRWVWKRGIKSL